MFTLRSLIAVALAAAFSFPSSLLVATDLSLPFSNASEISRSYASSFDDSYTSIQMIPRRLAARNRCLQEIVIFFIYMGRDNHLVRFSDERLRSLLRACRPAVRCGPSLYNELYH